MEDDKSTSTVEAAADTDIEADTNVDLEDMEVSFEDSDTDEEEVEAPADTEDSEDEEDESDTGDDEETEEAKDSDTEAELSPEEQRKQHNREMAEQRLREKQQRELALAQQNENYLNEAVDEQDRALREVQIQSYQNTVEINTSRLTTGYERAIKDFDVLSDSSPAVQRRLERALDTFQQLHVSMDSMGNPSRVTGDLYNYLKDEADAITELRGEGSRAQANAKTKEKSKAATLPVRTPKKAKVDSDLAAFDEEAKSW